MVKYFQMTMAPQLEKINIFWCACCASVLYYNKMEIDAEKLIDVTDNLQPIYNYTL